MVKKTVAEYFPYSTLVALGIRYSKILISPDTRCARRSFSNIRDSSGTRGLVPESIYNIIRSFYISNFVGQITCTSIFIFHWGGTDIYCNLSTSGSPGARHQYGKNPLHIPSSHTISGIDDRVIATTTEQRIKVIIIWGRTTGSGIGMIPC